VKKYTPLFAFWIVSMIAVVTGTFLYKSHQSADYDAVAIPYIKTIVPEISKWDAATTKALMAAEVVAVIPEDKFGRAMAFFSKLGALKSMEEPVFEKAFVEEETPDIGKQTIVEYNVEAVFENGGADINLKLLYRDDKLEIYRFNFGSDALMPQ
jgi:hypothetical protein